MTNPQESKFGVNLMAQLIIAVALSLLGSMLYGNGAAIVLQGLSVLFWMTFAFGFMYGIFRMVGVRSESMEGFYQSFPIRSGSAFGSEAMKNSPAPRAESQQSILHKPVEWNKIFSFQFLRFVGVLLIITSVFSLLFNIEWDLLLKIIASVVSGLLLLGGAEWLRTKKGGISAFLAVLSFALLQFSLSLLYKYAVQNAWGPIFVNGDTWLYLKIALTLLMIFATTRYPAAWMPLLYMLVAYFTPTSLAYVDATLSPLASAIFIVMLSVITLASAHSLKRSELIVANSLLANAYFVWLLLSQAGYNRMIAMVILVAIFAAQLLATALTSSKNPGKLPHHVANIVFSHIMIVIGLMGLRGYFPLMNDYFGVALLIAANITLLSSLVADKAKAEQNVRDVLLNSAVILASIGLFIQVDGPWSAVVFLAYSTLVLWYSLYQSSLRTRIYGSILLVISLFKLYLEFSDIFDHVWGSVAILAIGLVLVLLSYKFEAVKDVMLHGMGGKKQS